jgi:hypothetical protein
MLSKDRLDREPQSPSRLLRRERRRTTSRDFREESRQPDGYRLARDDCFDSPLLLRSQKRQYHDDNSEADQPRKKSCNSAPDSHPESSYYKTRKSGHDNNSRHDERRVEAHYRHILEKLRDRTTTIDRIDSFKRKPVRDDYTSDQRRGLLDIQIEITKQKVNAAMSAATRLELLYERAQMDFRQENEGKRKMGVRRGGR